MNIPYVKQFDQNGILANPIKGSYTSDFPNRSKRRKELGINKRGVHNPKKQTLLLVEKRSKSYLSVQNIVFLDEFSNIKRRVITHFTEVIPKN